MLRVRQMPGLREHDDPQALEHVAACRDSAGLAPHVTLLNANLVYLALGRQKLDVPPQDLVYSIGLIDYFNDKLVGILA